MKTLILAAIRCSLMFLLPTLTYAMSAQWDLDPTSGDWNTPVNWTPMDVPNGPTDIATFGLSNTTDVSISANTEVNSIVFTPAATNPYTITASPGLTLTISGVGIVNNSGRTQNFLTSDASGNAGAIIFSHHASAGSNVSISNGEGGTTNFFDHSNAGTAFIDNFEGTTNFFNRSSAGNALIETFSGHVSFWDNSTAGNAYIGVTDNSFLQFFDNATAAHATIGLTGIVVFGGSSTAGNATIRSFGYLDFGGNSRGGTAQIELGSSLDLGYIGVLDISSHNAPGVTIGSLEGAFPEAIPFQVFLGANNLTVGSNNLSTTFAGVIQDGFQGGSLTKIGSGTLIQDGFQGGSLTKIGSGTLILTGANTYTGDTNVNHGVLQVDGSIASNTFVNRRGTLAGTGTINGNVTNNGRVSPGSAASPGMLTVTGNFTQAQYATLMIKLAGESAGQFSVLNVMGNADLNGTLNPVLLNGFVLSLGDSFVFLNYASLTGEFSHIRDPLPGDGLQFGVIYEANHAILTVEQNVPDQGSTFLLLTLGLLGLVIYRRQLLHG